MRIGVLTGRGDVRRAALVTLALLVLAGAVPAAAADRVLHRRDQALVVRPIDGEPSTLVDLTHRLDHRDATWSPDGTTVVYTDGTGVWSVAADGSAAPRLVVDDTDAWSVDVSPDGRLLAYDRRGEGDTGIVIAPLSGEEPGRQITTPDSDTTDVDPVWAPDGGGIAFRRLDRGLGRWDLRLASVDVAQPLGPAPVRVLLEHQAWTTLTAPVWEPDGTRLLITAVRLGGTGHHELFRVARDGAAVERLLGGGEFAHHAPAVSPDGRFIAYGRQCVDCTQDQMQEGDGSGVWLADLVTGTQSLLAATDGQEREISWTADAGSVVFESFFQDSGCHCDISDLYAVDAPTGVPVQLDTFLHGPLGLEVSPGVALRLSGPTRIETSVAVARAAFETADVVVLARADTYADALAGAPLAGSLDGPVLLSPPDHLPPVIEQEIARLGTRQVVLLGDETALSPAVEAQLSAMVAAGDLDTVERIGGATRYDTAALVASRLPADHAYVVQGAAADPARGWPDAVAVAGLAAAEAAPLLLTEHDRLPAETATAITDAGLSAVTIVGGPAAVSEDVEQQLRDLGVLVDRLEGANRYETSVAVAHRAREGGASPRHVWLATGRNWPDTLAAGPAAAHSGAILLLADGVEPNGSAATWNFLEAERVQRAWLVGGPDVLSPATAVAVERRAGP